MTSATDGSLTFPLWIACRSAAGRRGRHGIDERPFAVVGRPRCALPVLRLADEYTRRFGIEPSERVTHQVRARTTSRDPRLRLLLMGVACEICG